jgi:hypothetical protein
MDYDAPQIIDIRPRPEPLTYHAFTDTMWRGSKGKIAAIKLWRDMHRVAPVAFGKDGKPVVPSLLSAKKVVETVRSILRDRDLYQSGVVCVTCRVSEDYNVFSTLDGDDVDGYDTLTRKQRG